ncbi:26176_t:CDS:1, partial [Racocetra persica]
TEKFNVIESYDEQVRLYNGKRIILSLLNNVKFCKNDVKKFINE